ncbi:MAG: sulfate/thiosulfate transport system substrate-binding protein [Alphaproteobacteria bacterium]|nr:sulfate/thiosulfate transport system substrate-binding protein [Alphaproteobacteria bacterium]
MKLRQIIATALTVASLSLGVAAHSETIELLNVSYDPTREFYEAYNELFVRHWKEKTGQDINIKQSHGGSGKQARSVIDGLRADVVTLALAYDIDAIAERAKLLPPDWQEKYPNNSSPYTSTIVFLVKKNNPKNIKDWDDLVKDGVQIITPNPKTSGGARWNYLAAYGYALKKSGGDETLATEFVKKLFANVPVLDTGARGATTTFVQRGIGDVLLAWENEAFLAVHEIGNGQFDIVVPSVSILAEPPVAVIDKNASKHGTLAIAREYLGFLYSQEAQTLAGKNFYRPSDPEIAAQFEATFPKTRLLSIADFGGWKAAQKKHFDDGGIFDRIMMK